MKIELKKWVIERPNEPDDIVTASYYSINPNGDLLLYIILEVHEGPNGGWQGSTGTRAYAKGTWSSIREKTVNMIVSNWKMNAPVDDTLCPVCKVGRLTTGGHCMVCDRR